MRWLVLLALGGCGFELQVTVRAAAGVIDGDDVSDGWYSATFDFDSFDDARERPAMFRVHDGDDTYTLAFDVSSCADVEGMSSAHVQYTLRRAGTGLALHAEQAWCGETAIAIVDRSLREQLRLRE